MKTELYADALIAMVKNGTTPAHAVQALAKYLGARGKSSIVRRLGATLARKHITDERREVTVLEVARRADADAARQAAAPYHGGQTAVVREDENLVGGWRLVGQNTLVDNSYKKHLLDFYKQLTR